jgi:hypothetical protein
MTESNRLPRVLLALRLSVFLVMVMWTVDKLQRPEHATQVFEHFYGLAGLGASVFVGIAIAELLLLLAFVLGMWKRLTYGLVFLLHAASTLASYQQYLHPFENVNLLFFAAWPMLAAAGGLYLLRDQDTICSLGGRPSA